MALFGFLGGKKTSVGLDIGSGIIKLVVIDHSGSEPELIKVATTEVAADAIVEGEVMDPGIVAEAIRGLFDTAGVKRKAVVTAVGGRDVIVAANGRPCSFAFRRSSNNATAAMTTYASTTPQSAANG